MKMKTEEFLPVVKEYALAWRAYPDVVFRVFEYCGDPCCDGFSLVCLGIKKREDVGCRVIPEDALVCSYPKIVSIVFKYTGDVLITALPDIVGAVELYHLLSVVPVKAILSSEPHEAVTILYDGFYIAL